MTVQPRTARHSPAETPEQVQQHTNGSHATGAVGLLLGLPPATLAVALGAIGIGNRSLWNDEYATWYAASLPLRDLFRLTDNVDAVLTPYYLLMHLWIALAGDSETSLRVPSLVATGLACAVVTFIGRRLFGSGVGITAGFVLACLPSTTRYAQEARPFALVVAVAALSTLLLLRAIEQPTGRRWTGYGLCLAVVPLLHLVAGVLLIAHAAAVWSVFRRRSDFRLFRWFLPAAATVTMVTPLAAKGGTQSAAIAWIHADGQALQQLPERLFGATGTGLLLLITALVAAALLWSVDRPSMTLLLSWALIPPVVAFLTFPVLHAFLHRYFLFTVPAWVLLASAAGYSAARLLTNRLPGLSVSAGTGAVLLAVVIGLSLHGYEAVRRSPVTGEPDFRGAAAVINARSRIGDAVAFNTPGRNGRLALAYESRRIPRPADVFLARDSRMLGTFGTAECADATDCADQYDRIWLITTSTVGPVDGMPDAIAGVLRDQFRGVEVQRVDRVSILLFVRSATSP